MKKLFLLSALVLGAMTMSGQIALEHVFTTSSYYSGVKNRSYENFDAGKLCIASDDTVFLYNDDMTLYKKVIIPIVQSSQQSARRVPAETMAGLYPETDYVSRNLFTTDGKVTFIHRHGTKDGDYITPHYCVYNEDGELLKELEGHTIGGIIMINGHYMLYTFTQTYIEYVGGACTTYIYSLPGNGQPIGTNTPTAPIRTSNARKVVENGQLYIILDGVKYAVTGTEL